VRIAVGLLLSNGFPVPAAFVTAWTRVLQMTLTGANNAMLPADLQIDEMNVIYVHDFPIDFARNRTVKLFLDEDKRSDYLLFLDVDMTHPHDIIHRLVAHRKDVVTGRYVMRKPPFFSVAMLKTGDGPTDYQAIEKIKGSELTGLHKVDAAGAGALLISRECLEAMRARNGDDWFRYQDGPDGLRSRSEDMWFYEQAKAAGFQPWLDADLWCGHERREIVGPKDHVPYAEAFKVATETVGT
jgi:hypothetical protein